MQNAADPGQPCRLRRMRFSHVRRFALLMAVAGVLLRGLIPPGFMPGWTGELEGQARSWLAICPAGELQALLPRGHHHHHHGADHSRHQLSEAHLSCPFAAAAAPALPSSPFTSVFAPTVADAGIAAVVTSAVFVFPRLRPPARAPPRNS